MRRRIIAFVIAWALALNCFPAYGGVNASAATKKTTKTTKTTKTVKLNAKTKTITVGKTATIKLVNSKKKAKWTTSKKSVCAITKTTKYTVKVKAKKAGTATITAKVGKKKYKCKVTVKAKPVAVQAITLSSYTENILVGEYAFIDNTIAPSNATDKTVVWTSSDTSICEVNNGVVYGKSPGNTKITATAGNKTATCTIIVDEVGQVSNLRLERNAANNGYNLSFSLTSRSGVSVKANGTAHIGVYNNAKQSKFKKDFFFTDKDFVNRSSATYVSTIYMCSIPLLDSEFDIDAFAKENTVVSSNASAGASTNASSVASSTATTSNQGGLISLTLDLLSGKQVPTAVQYIKSLKEAASSDAIIKPIDITIVDPSVDNDSTKTVVSSDSKARVNVMVPFIEYDAKTKKHNLVFKVKRSDKNALTSASGFADITINNGGKIVYEDKLLFSETNFGYRKSQTDDGVFMATVPLNEAKIAQGTTTTGVASVVIYILNSDNNDYTHILMATDLPKNGSASMDASSVATVSIKKLMFDPVTCNAQAEISQKNVSGEALFNPGNVSVNVYGYNGNDLTASKNAYSTGNIQYNEKSFNTTTKVFAFSKVLTGIKPISGYAKYCMVITVITNNGKIASESALIVVTSATTTAAPATTTQKASTTQAPTTASANATTTQTPTTASANATTTEAPSSNASSTPAPATTEAVTFNPASCNASFDAGNVIVEFNLTSSDGTSTATVTSNSNVKIKYNILSGDASGDSLTSGEATPAYLSVYGGMFKSTIATGLGNPGSNVGVIRIDIYYKNEKIGTKDVQVSNLP